MSTSSATRLPLSTWVALTTMQRKWRDNHPSIFPLRGPQTKPTNETRERRLEKTWTLNLFPGVRLIDDEFYANKDKKTTTNNKNSSKKSVSNSSHTHQEFPWEAGGCGDCPCVIHILTSVFQCEGRIIHVCCGQLSPIWTSEIQMASEQELWYYMCIKNKKNRQKKNKTKTTSLDICCTLNGLFILNFVSIGLVY